MRLRYESGTREALATLTPPVKRRTRAALQELARDPGSERLDLKVLTVSGPGRMYRCRVHRHRIVVEIRADAVYVKRIFHRRDGYGWLERMG